MAYKYGGKNYLFSASLPGAVYVPELGATFADIRAAASALGIGTDRIARVLTGKQKTAGGYHFQRGKKSDVPKPPPDPRAGIKRRIKQKIKQANDIIQKARDAQREGFLDNVSELDDFGRDVIGQTGDNLIDDTSDVLDDMDEEELEQLDKKLSDMIDKALEDMKKADDRLQEYADIFGVSSAEMEKYEPLIPDINRTIDRAKAFGIGSDVFELIKEEIQNNVHPDSLRELLDKMNAFFDDPGRFKNWIDALKDWEFRSYDGRSWEEIHKERYSWMTDW